MTYLKIGTTFVSASHILAVSPSPEANDGLLLAMLGGADVYLDAAQAALFLAHLASVPGRLTWKRIDVMGFGDVIEIFERDDSDPEVTKQPTSSIDVAHLRFS